jgi:hypothetical protein
LDPLETSYPSWWLTQALRKDRTMRLDACAGGGVSVLLKHNLHSKSITFRTLCIIVRLQLLRQIKSWTQLLSYSLRDCNQVAVVTGLAVPDTWASGPKCVRALFLTDLVRSGCCFFRRHSRLRACCVTRAFSCRKMLSLD